MGTTTASNVNAINTTQMEDILATEDNLDIEIYDRKPARVLAVKVHRENCHEVARWLKENDIRVFTKFHMDRLVYYTTDKNGKEQQMTVRFGDWIIRSSLGNFVPCKNEHFRRTYEKAKTID